MQILAEANGNIVNVSNEAIQLPSLARGESQCQRPAAIPGASARSGYQEKEKGEVHVRCIARCTKKKVQR